MDMNRNKIIIYVGSAIFVTTGMLIIKGIGYAAEVVAKIVLGV